MAKRYIAPIGVKGDTLMSGPRLKSPATICHWQYSDRYDCSRNRTASGKGAQLVVHRYSAQLGEGRQICPYPYAKWEGPPGSSGQRPIGQVGNVEHSNIKLGKAGRSRHLGRRPAVRGSAMSQGTIHGGGEGHWYLPGPRPMGASQPWLQDKAQQAY